MTSLHVATEDDLHGTENEAERTYTSSEVIALAGVTYRMLDYWCRSRFLQQQVDPGSGYARRFTAREVDLVHAMRALLDSGFTVQAAREIAPQLVDDERFGRRVADMYDLTIVLRRSEPAEADS